MKKPTAAERLSSVIQLCNEARKKLALASDGDAAEWEEIAEDLDLATDDLRAVVMLVDAKQKALA